jgi:uncharacterized protein (DUF1800 family)
VATRADIEHLLRRTEYIAKTDRLNSLAPGTTLPTDQVSAAQLAAAVDDILNISPTAVPTPQNLTYHDENNGWEQFLFALYWWLDRMVDVPRPMQEKMTFFWHGLLCTSWEKVSRAPLMMEQNTLFRNHGLNGNYRYILQTMSLQPAMLIYLDNIENHKDSPNQNFARELMELFSLGVGNYTEDDVAAAAAAWTGHGISWDTYNYEYRGWDHDGGNKTFMGETKNWNGPDIITRILDRTKPQAMIVCKYLSRKLWEFFAYQNPSDAIVNALAQVLWDNDFNIKPWLRTMLLRPEFCSTEAKQGMIMTPVDWVVNMMYRTGLRKDDLGVSWLLDGMGQVPFRPPNVSGWRPNLYWINSSTMGARAQMAQHVTWRLRSDGTAHRIDDRTPDGAVDYMLNLFGLAVSATSRNALKTYVTEQRKTNDRWAQSSNLMTMTLLAPDGHMA